ncbi:MAG: polymer-forming cytoskeletal protein [Spartobacteria bacterium]|nr:polymer-forming cytoskeletal protein [Spartobacteria bacterium]
MDNTNSDKTIIGENITINGTIKSNEAIHIDGALEGDLICHSDATIGESARIKGNVEVDSVIIEGEVHGNITAADKVALRPTAKVYGDIKAKRLSVDDGVTVVGHVEVNPAKDMVPEQDIKRPKSLNMPPLRPNQSGATEPQDAENPPEEEKKRIFITL